MNKFDVWVKESFKQDFWGNWNLQNKFSCWLDVIFKREGNEKKDIGIISLEKYSSIYWIDKVILDFLDKKKEYFYVDKNENLRLRENSYFRLLLDEIWKSYNVCHNIRDWLYLYFKKLLWRIWRWSNMKSVDLVICLKFICSLFHIYLFQDFHKSTSFNNIGGGWW